MTAFLVPQGGFEPSTYRLRSDCSAVELLRPHARSSKEAGRCRSVGQLSYGRSTFVYLARATAHSALPPLHLVDEQAACSVCSPPQPNPGLPGFGHLRFAGSGQARSRLGRGWGWGSMLGHAPRVTTWTPTPPAFAALRRATLPTRGRVSRGAVLATMMPATASGRRGAWRARR